MVPLASAAIAAPVRKPWPTTLASGVPPWSSAKPAISRPVEKAGLAAASRQAAPSFVTVAVLSSTAPAALPA